MLIAKFSLVDFFFFCRQLMSTQLRGGLGVLVLSIDISLIYHLSRY